MECRSEIDRRRLLSLVPPAQDEGDDSPLVQRAIDSAKRGESDGLHFLYVRYAASVQRYLAGFVDPVEAEDITQNVFAKLITAIDKYERREVPFAAWLMRVARNAALDQMRARRALPAEEIRLDDGGREQTGLDLARTLRDALQSLPDDQREVLVLRHVAGLSPVEIARALSRSESSIHGLHHRGRRTLRAKLVELGAAPVVAPRAAS